MSASLRSFNKVVPGESWTSFLTVFLGTWLAVWVHNRDKYGKAVLKTDFPEEFDARPGRLHFDEALRDAGTATDSRTGDDIVSKLSPVARLWRLGRECPNLVTATVIYE